MNNKYLESLLYESESESIEFKREQYKFQQAANDEKSEFLKDIIAMANAWRRTEGLILLGIEESHEKPNKIIGISSHIDDAAIQEFVNSKTNKICEFNYKTYSINDKTIAIIHIPVQQRPIYLKKRYGKLSPNTVYIRRGSSTTIASIEEISKMGGAVATNDALPDLHLHFYNNKTGKKIGDSIECKGIVYEIKDSIPDAESVYNDNFPTPGEPNKNYYREFLKYINFKKGFFPFNIEISNTGNIEANDICIELHFAKDDAEILVEGQEIEEPRFSHNYLFHDINTTPAYCNLEVINRQSEIIVITNLSILHANRSTDIVDSIYIQPKSNKKIEAQVRIYCSSVNTPFVQTLEFTFNYIFKKINWNEFSSFLE